MGIVHSTDQYTLTEQSTNIDTLIEQSLHGCFVVEFHPPASKLNQKHKYQFIWQHCIQLRQLYQLLTTNWSGRIPRQGRF